MASRRTFALCAAAVLCAGGATRGIEPADPNLIPEGRALLGYLEGIHGRRVLTGINGVRNAEKVHQVCGRHAAVLSVDISGRRNPTDIGGHTTYSIPCSLRPGISGKAKGGEVFRIQLGRRLAVSVRLDSSLWQRCWPCSRREN